MSQTSPETVRAIDATVMAELTRQQEAGVKFLVGLNVDDLVAAIAATLPAGFAQAPAEPASAMADISRRLEDVIVMINSPGEYSRVYVAGACRVILGLIESRGHAQSSREPVEQECFDMLWEWFRERRGNEDMRTNASQGGLSADDFKQMLDEHEANLLPTVSVSSTSHEGGK